MLGLLGSCSLQGSELERVYLEHIPHLLDGGVTNPSSAVDRGAHAAGGAASLPAASLPASLGAPIASARRSAAALLSERMPRPAAMLLWADDDDDDDDDDDFELEAQLPTEASAAVSFFFSHLAAVTRAHCGPSLLSRPPPSFWSP